MPTAIVKAGNGLARALLMLGHFSEARAIALEARELDRRLGNSPRRWGSPTPWLHAIEISVGDPAAAIRALRHDAQTEPDPHFRLRIRQNIAATLAEESSARSQQRLAAQQLRRLAVRTWRRGSRHRGPDLAGGRGRRTRRRRHQQPGDREPAGDLAKDRRAAHHERLRQARAAQPHRTGSRRPLRGPGTWIYR